MADDVVWTFKTFGFLSWCVAKDSIFSTSANMASCFISNLTWHGAKFGYTLHIGWHICILVHISYALGSNPYNCGYVICNDCFSEMLPLWTTEWVSIRIVLLETNVQKFSGYLQLKIFVIDIVVAAREPDIKLSLISVTFWPILIETSGFHSFHGVWVISERARLTMTNLTNKVAIISGQELRTNY